MRALTTVLAAKIVVTLICWVFPLLFFPVEWFLALGFPCPEPLLFLRLLGVSYLSLSLGYAFGLRVTLRGEYPGSTVWVGILSNGGSFAVLLVAGLASDWKSWGTAAQAAMWFFLTSVGAITVALVACGPLRRWS